MDAAALVARLLLATVFAVAGFTKLRDPGATAQAMTALGAGPRSARPAARLLPVAELAVAVGLLIEALVVPAAIASFVLLSVFTGAIVNAVRLNRRPDCGCFGNVLSKRVSAWTAARNVVLAALAAFVAIHGSGASLTQPFGFLIVAVATAALVMYAGRRSASVAHVPPAPAPSSDRHGMPLGTAAPDFELRGPCDGAASLGSLSGAGLPLVLIFLGAGCGACSELHPHLARWQVTLGERVSIAVIMAGGADAAGDLCTEHGVGNVLADDGEDPLWATYEMPGTPSAVAIGPDGRIASASVRGADGIEELVRQTVRHGLPAADEWTQLTPAG